MLIKAVELRLDDDGQIYVGLMDGRRYLVDMKRHAPRPQAIFETLEAGIGRAAWDAMIQSGISLRIDTRAAAQGGTGKGTAEAEPGQFRQA
jgi:hypothetical protein